MIRLLSLVFLVLAGCVSKPPEASGSYRALNPGRWQPTADDLYGVRTTQPFAQPTPAEARP